MDAKEALEHLVTTVKDGIESEQKLMTEPDQDWLPTAFMVDADAGLAVVMIDPEFMSTPMTKEILATAVLPGIIAEHSSVAAAFVATAWQADYDHDHQISEQLRQLRPSQRPDRWEVVMFTAATAFEFKVMCARVERHPDSPPTLAEWEEWPTDDRADGLFPKALRAGLVRQG
jgi:hypothetical protein